MADLPPSKIELNPDALRLAEQLLASGRFNSVQEAIQAGLRLLADEEAKRAATADDIRRKISAGIEQEERGELLDGDAVMAEWHRRDEEEGRPARRTA